VVPARFWPSDDYRELTFRFGDVRLTKLAPPGALNSDTLEER
jgi:hypothetical protein